MTTSSAAKPAPSGRPPGPRPGRSQGAAGPCVRIDPAAGLVTMIQPAASPAREPAADGGADTLGPPPTNPGAALVAQPVPEASSKTPPSTVTPSFHEHKRAEWRRRKRRQKQRKDNGALVVRMVLDEDLLDALVIYHWIGDGTARRRGQGGRGADRRA